MSEGAFERRGHEPRLRAARFGIISKLPKNGPRDRDGRGRAGRGCSAAATIQARQRPSIPAVPDACSPRSGHSSTLKLNTSIKCSCAITAALKLEVKEAVVIEYHNDPAVLFVATAQSADAFFAITRKNMNK